MKWLVLLLAMLVPLSCTDQPPQQGLPGPSPLPADSENIPERPHLINAALTTECVRQHPRVIIDPAPEWLMRCGRSQPDSPWTCYPYPGEEVYWTVTVRNYDPPATCGPITYSPSLGGGRTSPGEKIPPYLKLDPHFYPSITVPASGLITYWAESYAIEYAEDRTELGPMPVGEFWVSTLTWRKGTVSGTGVVQLWVIERPPPTTSPTPGGVTLSSEAQMRACGYLVALGDELECP